MKNKRIQAIELIGKLLPVAIDIKNSYATILSDLRLQDTDEAKKVIEFQNILFEIKELIK